MNRQLLQWHHMIYAKTIMKLEHMQEDQKNIIQQKNCQTIQEDFILK